MPRPRPPYLQKQITRHGKVVFYVRRGDGPRIKTRAAYGTPEFMAEYQAACIGRTVALAQGRVREAKSWWLIRRYRESSAWASLAPATRDQREKFTATSRGRPATFLSWPLHAPRSSKDAKTVRRRQIRQTIFSNPCADFSDGRRFESPRSTRRMT